jgi:stage V sporulation protein B
VTKYNPSIIEIKTLKDAKEAIKKIGSDLESIDIMAPKSSIQSISMKNLGSAALTGRQILKRIIHQSIPITICIGAQYAGNLVDLGNTKQGF